MRIISVTPRKCHNPCYWTFLIGHHGRAVSLLFRSVFPPSTPSLHALQRPGQRTHTRNSCFKSPSCHFSGPPVQHPACSLTDGCQGPKSLFTALDCHIQTHTVFISFLLPVQTPKRNQPNKKKRLFWLRVSKVPRPVSLLLLDLQQEHIWRKMLTVYWRGSKGEQKGLATSVTFKSCDSSSDSCTTSHPKDSTPSLSSAMG